MNELNNKQLLINFEEKFISVYIAKILWVQMAREVKSDQEGEHKDDRIIKRFHNHSLKIFISHVLKSNIFDFLNFS